MHDPFNLHRFLDAQAGTYEAVVSELAAGRKSTHWMWFIFPQVAGLGHSYTAELYAIRSSTEARAYLDHPVLGKRLTECANLLLATTELSAVAIFGSPDHLKLRSSMALFASTAGPDSIFDKVLEKFYGGVADQATIAVLAKWSGSATEESSKATISRLAVPARRPGGLRGEIFVGPDFDDPLPDEFWTSEI